MGKWRLKEKGKYRCRKYKKKEGNGEYRRRKQRLRRNNEKRKSGEKQEKGRKEKWTINNEACRIRGIMETGKGKRKFKGEKVD